MAREMPSATKFGAGYAFFFTPSQDSLFSGDQLGRAYWREARFKWVAKMSRLGLGAEEGAVGRLLGPDRANPGSLWSRRCCQG